MASIIAVKVDLSMVDMKRLFDGRNGAKYLDLILLPSRNPRFGESHIVKQSVTKEERQARLEMPILGNAKEIGLEPQNGYQPRQQVQNNETQDEPADF